MSPRLRLRLPFAGLALASAGALAGVWIIAATEDGRAVRGMTRGCPHA